MYKEKLAISLRRKEFFRIFYIFDKCKVFEEQRKNLIYVGEFFLQLCMGPPFMFQFRNIYFGITAL